MKAEGAAGKKRAGKSREEGEGNRRQMKCGHNLSVYTHTHVWKCQSEAILIYAIDMQKQ